MATDGTTNHTPEGNIIETIQSLIVAFVLAMMFRGFVTEGFVIPTGSMAPTLLGQHTLVHSQQTGFTFAIGADTSSDSRGLMVERIADPMLGEHFPGSGSPRVVRPRGMGDRILVVKTLYPFFSPQRYDVVVFKNPTDPLGDAANYIKRLIGLPNEQVWLADGDVFARASDQRSAISGDGSNDSIAYSEFKVQRKPEHVQRAVWQPVYNSDYAPVNPRKISTQRVYDGPPWMADAAVWDLGEKNPRIYRSNTDKPTTLAWENSRRSINDWTPYNMLATNPPAPPPLAVSDLRVGAGIIATQPGLKTTLELETRGYLFQFIIQDHGSGQRATATMRMQSLLGDSQTVEWSSAVTLPPPGTAFNVEFWHVDQAMQLFINGKAVAPALEYDWSPLERLQHSIGDTTTNDVDLLVNRSALQPQLRWKFEGSPVTLHRVRVDRDLHYRHDVMLPRRQQRNGPYIEGHAFGTHPTENAAILGPDQFMMCGDNSQMSLDSRLWGRPHPLVVEQIGDDSPFIVPRKMLVGRAWCVYFPAPYALKDGGLSVVPDFGRLRFIR